MNSQSKSFSDRAPKDKSQIPMAMLGLSLRAIVLFGALLGGSELKAQGFSTCSVDVTTNVPATIPVQGGSYFVTLRFNIATCGWQATAENAALSASSGVGSATFTMMVGANQGDGERRITLNLAQKGGLGGYYKTVSFPQAGRCPAVVQNVPATVPVLGGTYTLNLQIHSSCTWTATSNVAWAVLSPPSGKGLALIKLVVGNNTGGQRSGTLTIAGVQIQLNQAGCPAAVVTPTRFYVSPSGETVNASLQLPAGCPWSASGTIVAVSPTSGTGDAKIAFTIGPNTNPGPRTLYANIGGVEVSLLQDTLCKTLTVTPSSVSIPAKGGTATLNIQTIAGCYWSMTPAGVMASPLNGYGSGTVSLSLWENPSTTARSFTPAINGITIQVAQAGNPCAPRSATPTSISSGANGGNIALTLTAPSGCAWTLDRGPSWVVPLTALNPGNGGTYFAVQPNSGTAPRTDTLVLSGTTVSITQAGQTVRPGQRLFQSDYDGDGKADLTVWRPSNGIWHIIPSSSTCPVLFTNGGLHGGKVWCFRQFGLVGDEPISGDFDGDHKADLVIWRKSAGRFLLLPSSNHCPTHMKIVEYTADKRGICERVWGNANEIFARGDFDGDGKMDQASVRSTDFVWTVMPSTGAPPPHFGVGGYTGEGQVGTHFVFGSPGDKPVPSDYDGDGKTDPAVWRPAAGKFLIAPSSGICPPNTAIEGLLSSGVLYCSRGWGGAGLTPVIDDYDGDHMADEAFVRDVDFTWTIMPSSNLITPLNPKGLGFTPEGQFAVEYQWGMKDDVAAQADYDGDGKSDITVWRVVNGTPYLLTLPSTGTCPTHYAASDQYLGRTFCLQQWGLPGDVPRP